MSQRPLCLLPATLSPVFHKSLRSLRSPRRVL
jgi:hypothetical protein